MDDREISHLSDFEENYWWNVGRRKILCALINKQISNGKKIEILDIGCGSGGTSTTFLQFGRVIGTDFSHLGLKLAKKKGLVDVVRSSSTSIPFNSERFDIITILDVLEHIQDDRSVIEEIWRMLKPNGIILITVPAFQFLWSQHDIVSSHVRRYNKQSLTSVLKDSKFRIIKLSYFVSFLFPIVATYRLLSKYKINKENPKGDMVKFPKLINNFFKKLMEIENILLKKINFPFGLSIVCVAKK